MKKLLFFTLLFLTFTTFGAVYKWTDEKGGIHYSKKTTNGINAQEVEIKTASSPPTFVTTEHFTTTYGALVVTLDPKLGPTIFYTISYKIIKSFGDKVFCEFEFQNPAADYGYVSSTRYIAADETEFVEKSPSIRAPKPGEIYRITLRVYRDKTKKELLAEHVQPIQAFNADMAEKIWKTLSGAKVLHYWAMDLASEPWKVGYSQKVEKQEIIEYVFNGETVLNWRELISELNDYTQIDYTQSDVRIIVDNYIADMKNKFNSFQFQFLQHDKDRVLIEWWQTDATGYGPEHAFFLFQSHSRGLHTLSYARKGPKMDDELRRKWLERFYAAKLMYVTQ
jgi:hypothetical protein